MAHYVIIIYGEVMEDKVFTFLDFDNNIFYDNFPEPNNYSLAINEDWTYSYDDFDTVVDASEQYWK